jgi:hypothetical protein
LSHEIEIARERRDAEGRVLTQRLPCTDLECGELTPPELGDFSKTLSLGPLRGELAHATRFKDMLTIFFGAHTVGESLRLVGRFVVVQLAHEPFGREAVRRGGAMLRLA